jgi:hypothetical protein
MVAAFGNTGIFYNYIGENMGYPDPILEEVRRMKADLLKTYGGIEGLHKHQDEVRPQLEKEGWKFITGEELRARY